MNALRVVVALLCLAITGWGEDGTPVSLSIGNPPRAYESIFYYTGTNVVTTCKAPSTVALSTITVSAATNASPVVFTATAHNLGDYANGSIFSPIVKITGGTGNWTVINGVWKATITSANAFSIAVNSTSLGALTGTLVVTTTAPRLNAPVWSIGTFIYDGSSNLVGLSWAGTAGGAGSTTLNGGSSGTSFACSNKANLGNQ